MDQGNGLKNKIKLDMNVKKKLTNSQRKSTFSKKIQNLKQEINKLYKKKLILKNWLTKQTRI
jgi:hypothetical protein